jgi:hypothetical protein
VNKRRLIAFGVFTISVLWTVSTFIPTVVKYWESFGINWAWCVFSIQLTAAIGYMVLSDYLSKADIDTAMEEWSKTLKEVGLLRSIQEAEFYPTFLQEIKTAQKNVDICHFARKPPERARDYEKLYYRELPNTIKNSRASCRRLERITKEKLPWIEEIIDTYKGVDNFSLRGLVDDDKSDQILPVSVQRIDDHKVYLVALAEHYATHGPRDISITSPELTLLFTQYFNERLWEKAVPLMSNGNLDENEWKKLKRKVNG